MGINGRAKGHTYERDVSNEFSLRFNDHFQRVPQSGAICGGFNRIKAANLRQEAQQILSADIICPSFFPFALECKNYGEKTGPQMYSILEGDERVLDKWLLQAKGDAQFAQKEFLIIFKITRKASYICVDFEKFSTKLKENPTYNWPTSYIKYKDTIIFDKNDFLDNYIVLYFPLEKRNIKTTKDINNRKVEVISDEQSQTT